jgi:amino acid transporter
VIRLLLYLELGILLPYNGGEFIYVRLAHRAACVMPPRSPRIQLQESYTRPKYFVACIFACLFVIVGNTAPNSLVFAEYVVTAFSPHAEIDGRLLKFVALVCITLICTLHVFSRQVGILANNGERVAIRARHPAALTQELALALYKVVFLLFVCVAGFFALGGVRVDEAVGDSYGTENLGSAFRQRIPTTPYSYAKSLLSVLYAFRGWYETVSARDGHRLTGNLGKMPTMSGSCPIVTGPGGAKTL